MINLPRNRSQRRALWLVGFVVFVFVAAFVAGIFLRSSVHALCLVVSWFSCS